jgi:serine/threonine protein kinase
LQEILGLGYISPSYDMWKLGCLLFEAATDSKLFDCRLRGPLEEAYGELGFSDQHFLLDSMTTALGSIPQQVRCMVC